MDSSIFKAFKREPIIKKNCSHYKNKVQIYANCCDKYYDCRLCHNEENNHVIRYGEHKKAKCIKCDTENDITTHCKNCKGKVWSLSLQ